MYDASLHLVYDDSLQCMMLAYIFVYDTSLHFMMQTYNLWC